MSRISTRLAVAGVTEALRTIARNPLRAALAAIAMAVAVATTAIVQTGLDGLAQSARAASARAFGSDTFVVARTATGNLTRRELADRLARNPVITRSDVRFVDSHAGDVVVYAATSQRPADVIAGPRRFENATVNGTQATLFEIRDVGIDRGRFFLRDEELRGAQVVVLGRAIADELFPAADPLGQTVRIAGRGFRVIGIQLPQGTAGGVSLDRYAWLPLTTFDRVFGGTGSLQLFAKAPDLDRTTAAEDRARASMRARRHLRPGEADTFDIITPEASRTFVANITERLGAAGPPISIMALIAAIVVVTNTTLVSVTQRTREIGVRRAVGASRASIIAEVLAESSLIAVAGGAAGIAAASAVLTFAARGFGTALPLEPRTIVASVAAAALSGLAAGWYPARRAASLDVVNALRQE